MLKIGGATAEIIPNDLPSNFGKGNWCLRRVTH